MQNLTKLREEEEHQELRGSVTNKRPIILPKIWSWYFSLNTWEALVGKAHDPPYTTKW